MTNILSFQFLEQIKQQITVYTSYPEPVLICDLSLHIYWSNETAKQFQPLSVPISKLGFLFEELDANSVLEVVKGKGCYEAKGIIPLNNLSAIFTPIFREQEEVAYVVGFSSTEGFQNHRIDYVSPSLELFSATIRGHLNRIFSVTDNIGLRADILKFFWINNYIRTIDMEGYQMLRIAENITSYSILQNNQVDLSYTVINLSNWLQDIYPLVRELASRIEVEVKLNLPENQQTSTVLDLQWFQEGFFNIIHNSLYYTKKGNEISISLSIDEDNTEITVEDSGLGIPKSLLPNIAKPYFSRPPRGQIATAGLGLAIAKRVACLHKGDLEISSIEGEGTIIRFTLPKDKLHSNISFAQNDKEELELNNRFSSLYIGLTSAINTPYYHKELTTD